MKLLRSTILALLCATLSALVYWRTLFVKAAEPVPAPTPIYAVTINWEESCPVLVYGVNATPTEPDTPATTDLIPLPASLQEAAQAACEAYGVDYALTLAVMENESSFDLDADNGVCWGPMQIHPINYEWLREQGIEPTTHEGNIVAGVLMLGDLLSRYGDTHKALMAYNCGETGAAKLWGEGYTTSAYSRAVVASSESWNQIINEHSGGN